MTVTFKRLFRKFGFVKYLEMTHIVGGGRVVMLFVSGCRIAYENRYVAHPLYLNTFVTFEKTELRNYD